MEGDVVSRLEPLLGILLEAVQDDAFEVRREIGGVIRHPRRVRLEDRAHRLDRRVGAEGPPSGEHLVEDGPKAKMSERWSAGAARICSGAM